MFIVDIMSRTPVYEQIIKQTEMLILKGILKPEEKMPSVRSLSLSLAINPNTIQKAYSELDLRKLIYSVPGKGSFVAKDALKILNEVSRNNLDKIEKDIVQLKLAGIKKEELLGLIEKIYNKD